jgi:hypothetical protein
MSGGFPQDRVARGARDLLDGHGTGAAMGHALIIAPVGRATGPLVSTGWRTSRVVVAKNGTQQPMHELPGAAEVVVPDGT